MLKTPISFKGPNGLIQDLFAEKTVYQATQMLLNEHLRHWHHNEVSSLSRAEIKDPDGNWYAASMTWPLTAHDEARHVGNCTCDAERPCVHLAALAIYNKAKLDQLPPFTQQLKALQNINTTFTNWLSRQWHDPFPNMARHRVVYLVDQTDSGAIEVKLYKAYLTQDDQYQIKAPIDSSLYFRKQLPKFVSEVDQYVMYQMNQQGLAKVHQFKINPERDQAMLLMMLKSRRCFWKACYRPPMQLMHVNAFSNSSGLSLTATMAFNQSNNSVELLSIPHQDQSLEGKDLCGDTGFVAQLCLDSYALSLPWRAEKLLQLDLAHIRFNVAGHEFDLEDLEQGLVQLNPIQLEQVATACYQVEKLPSVFASFEPPVQQNFQINDRYLGEDFVAVAPLLVALQSMGWVIHIEPTFRLNHTQAKQWYVEINPAKEQAGGGWFDFSIGVELNDKKYNLMPFLIKAIKTGAFDTVKQELMVQLDQGLNIGVDKQQVAQIITTLSELYDGSDAPEQLRLSKHQLLTVAQAKPYLEEALETGDAQLHWLGHQQIKQKAQALEAINELPMLSPPVGLEADLRPYQIEGYSWLCFLAAHGFHGLLADDMGLGKTLQTLAFIQAQINQNKGAGTALVVAPTSLLGNWVAEAHRFTPELKVGFLSGPKRKAKYNQFNDYDLLVCSYGIISRDIKHLAEQNINLLVLDEAQAIKNRRTRVARAIKQLNPSHRLCLSGTPVENHLGELWSIFDYLMPGFLGSEQQFQKQFQWPIEREKHAGQLKELQNRIAPFVLRRTKHEVAKELPDKSEIIKFIELDEGQATVYESIRLTMADEIRKAMKSQQNNQILIGNALLRLRQVCCHPRLVPFETVDEHMQSAKLNWLMTALPNLVEEGRQILIFSSFTSMLAIIAEGLQELGIQYYELTGKTPAKQRTADIEDYQALKRPVFLISLKAGGAGINLTAADTVIHFDPWWNPAAEQQASDRAHRIGQDKQVFVYKLITRGTVEEKIHRLQLEKQQLATGVLSQQADISSILSQHQWETMLSPIKTNE